MTDLLILLMLPGAFLYALGICWGLDSLEANWPWWIIGAGVVLMALAVWAAR